MRPNVKIVAGMFLCASFAWLTPADAQSERGQQRGHALGRRAATDVSSMDRNNDGIVARDEWTGSEQEFERRDWNRDGMLSGDELRFSAPPCEGGTTYDQAVPGGTSGRATAEEQEPSSNPAYQAGFDRGIADGRQAGKEDKQGPNRWDLEGQRELETADAGYQPSMGSHAEYQAGYRSGFRFGYRQGFGPH